MNSIYRPLRLPAVPRLPIVILHPETIAERFWDSADDFKDIRIVRVCFHRHAHTPTRMHICPHTCTYMHTDIQTQAIPTCARRKGACTHARVRARTYMHTPLHTSQPMIMSFLAQRAHSLCMHLTAPMPLCFNELTFECAGRASKRGGPGARRPSLRFPCCHFPCYCKH